MTRGFSWRSVFIPFAVHTAIVFLSAYVAMHIPELAPAGFVNPLREQTVPFVEKFIKWDAHWYTYTAQHGYDKQNIVFFPVLIVLLRALLELGLNISLFGFIICNLFAFSSFIFLYLVVRQHYSAEVAQRTLMVFAVMPTSFFLNTIYTESIFMTFSLASLYYLRQNSWWRAGLFAALATVTRNLGIVIVLVMIYKYITEYGQWRNRANPLAAMLLSPAALLGFMAFNYWQVGDVFAFFTGQQAWGRQFEYPWVNIWNNALLIQSRFPVIEPGIVIDMILVLFCIAVLLILPMRFDFLIPFPYLILGWIWFFIPLFSTSPWFPLYSMSRFILVVFPFYILLAQLPRPLFWLYWIASAVGLFFSTLWFTGWYWIG